MNDNLRRRQAAFILRQRAADALDQASELDGLPATRLLLTNLKAIAAKAGCDPEKLADAAVELYPGADEEDEARLATGIEDDTPPTNATTDDHFPE